MKVELRDAKVELEVSEGRSHLIVNGELVPLAREVGIRLVFGEGVAKSTTSAETVVGIKTRGGKGGCQSAASRRKLSASLKKFHAKRRARLRAAERESSSKKTVIQKVVTAKPGVRKANPKLNGAATHFPN